MRPPHPRNFVGIAEQVRPHFGVPYVMIPAPQKLLAVGKNNADDLMTQACDRGHEKIAIPLLEVNRYRSRDPSGDYGRPAPHPKLQRRPNEKAPILVRTFEVKTNGTRRPRSRSPLSRSRRSRPRGL